MVRSFHHIFFLKKPKKYEDGNPLSIYLRITVDGQRAEFATGREIDSATWESRHNSKRKTEKLRDLEDYLQALEQKLYEAHQALIRDNKVITAETLKNRFTGAGNKPRMLVPIFQKHNDEIKALVPQEFSPGTLERYKTCLAHTQGFLKYKYNTSDIDIRNINHEVIMDYDFYLRSVRKCSNNTVAKYIKNFKKIIRICIANGWLDKDPFVNYKVKLKEVERGFLSEQELNAILNKEFIAPRLNQVRDIFLFSCFTGLAYSDVKKMSY